MNRALDRKAMRRESILEAALVCFARHGYRRTSMDEVAREAGISRASLYLHFANKEALFRALSESINANLVDTAAVAAAKAGPIADRLIGVFEAKVVAFFELIASTEHGAELVDENNRLCGDLSAVGKKRFREILVGLLQEADRNGEIALADQGLDAGRVAELVLSAVTGIETNVGSELTTARLRRELGQMLRIIVAGLRPSPGVAVRS